MGRQKRHSTYCIVKIPLTSPRLVAGVTRADRQHKRERTSEPLKLVGMVAAELQIDLKVVAHSLHLGLGLHLVPFFVVIVAKYNAERSAMNWPVAIVECA